MGSAVRIISGWVVDYVWCELPGLVMVSCGGAAAGRRYVLFNGVCSIRFLIAGYSTVGRLCFC